MREAWSHRSSPRKGREGTLLGPRSPHPAGLASLGFASFPAANSLESGGKEERGAGLRTGVTGVWFPGNPPAGPQPERLPSAQEHRGAPLVASGRCCRAGVGDFHVLWDPT